MANVQQRNFMNMIMNPKNKSNIIMRAEKIRRDSQAAFRRESQQETGIVEVERAAIEQVEKIGKVMEDVMKEGANEGKRFVKEFKMRMKRDH